jgi:hypothetical protein
VTAGAEDADAAAELARAVEVEVTETPAGDRVIIRPKYPDTRDAGRVMLTARFTIRVPATATVQCQNRFGDSSISGISGNVVLDSRFGTVDLRDIGGDVNVRAWGEFDLRAHALRKGGTFNLQGTHAEFTNCAGPLRVHSFFGVVTVSEMPVGADVALTGESGVLTCVVPDNAIPSVRATVLDGELRSELELERFNSGRLQKAQAIPPEPTHTIVMDSVFADVVLRRASGLLPEAQPVAEGDVNTYDSKEYTYEIADDARVRIDAVPGNVRVRGGPGGKLVVKVTRRVRVDGPRDARVALEALAFRHEEIDDVTRLIASVSRDIGALAVSTYRVDLDVTCPPGTSVEVFGDDGVIEVSELRGSVRIEQEKGTVLVEDVDAGDAAIEILNRNGDVGLHDSTGNVSVIASQGSVDTRNVTGKQVLRIEGGNSLVESPRGELAITNKNGDAQVVALGGIIGPVAIEVEDGDLGMVVSEGAHVVYHVTYENGAVFPKSVPLDGTIQGRKGSFTGRLNDATHRVDLTVRNGNIYLD